MDISVVIPLYNEEESLPELHSWIKEVMQKNNFTYEIIMVDDGSRDNSWQVIEELSKKDENLKAIKFNRNYGKSPALNEGFKAAKGDVVITMDADLQDSPDEIPELYDLIKNQGYDLISGWKKERHDPISKTIPTKLFNYATRLASGIKLHDFNCGLKSYKNQVVKNVQIYGEMHRYIPVIAKWAGFDKIGEKVVKHQERKYGKTKFGLNRFINGFLDLLSVTFVSRFRKKPMHFFGTWGILSFLTGFILVAYLVSLKIYDITYGLRMREIADKPAFYLALVALVVGVQLFLTGFIAELLVINSHRDNEYVYKKTIGLD